MIDLTDCRKGGPVQDRESKQIGVVLKGIDLDAAKMLLQHKEFDLRPSRLVFGRVVYVYDFLKAAYESGTLDYHIVIMTLNQTLIDELNINSDVKAPRVFRFYSVAELPKLLQIKQIELLFAPGGETLGLLNLRNSVCEDPVPIVGTVHNVANAHASQTLDLFRILGGSLHVDALLAPSRCCLEAVSLKLTRLASDLALPTEVQTPRIVQIPLGIDTLRLIGGDKTLLRKELGWEAENIVLLYVGRLTPKDKADLVPLFRAFQMARRSIPSVRMQLVLAGQEEQGYCARLLASLEGTSLVEDVVHWSEPISPFGPLKQKLFAAADIFISPIDNAQETFGLTPLEANACGLPAIVSDIGGYREVVEHGVNGLRVSALWAGVGEFLDLLAPLLEDGDDHFFVSQGVAVDIAGLAEAIVQLSVSRDRRERMGREGRRLVVEKYSWLHVIDSLELMFRGLIDESSLPETKEYFRAITRMQLSRMRSFRNDILATFVTNDFRGELDSRIQRTQAGTSVLYHAEPLAPWYPGLQWAMSKSEVMQILRYTDEPRSIRQVLAELSLGSESPMTTKEFRIAWLLKQGYIVIVQPEW